MMPSTKDKGAQTEAIGSHFKEHTPERPSHETTTQVDYDCDPQKDKKGIVKCNDTPENHRGKHSPRMENHTTSPLRRFNYKEKEQGDSVTPDITRKEHMGRIAIRDD
jgi:hypothetical protein